MLSALKRLFAIALAMMTSRLTQTLNTFIAMAMIVQLGNTVLAAGLTISATRQYTNLAATFLARHYVAFICHRCHYRPFSG